MDGSEPDFPAYYMLPGMSDFGLFLDKYDGNKSSVLALVHSTVDGEILPLIGINKVLPGLLFSPVRIHILCVGIQMLGMNEVAKGEFSTNFLNQQIWRTSMC